MTKEKKCCKEYDSKSSYVATSVYHIVYTRCRENNYNFQRFNFQMLLHIVIDQADTNKINGRSKLSRPN